MPAYEIVALIALLGVFAYAILAGADFGGGVWDLLARGPRKQAQRRAIGVAMGPVWEANHVWLIFIIVVLFTAFPPAFAAMNVALFWPLHLVLVGIGAVYVSGIVPILHVGKNTALGQRVVDVFRSAGRGSPPGR